MKLPKFLLADNSNYPEDLFVVHTEFPRFILHVDEEEVEFFDDVEEEDTNEEINNVVKDAFDFYEAEIEKYEEDDELND